MSVTSAAVNQVLLDLSGKVDDEDNPIFSIAHLKQQKRAVPRWAKQLFFNK